jgi:hypothetical protein
MNDLRRRVPFLCDITLCSAFKFNRRLGGIYCSIFRVEFQFTYSFRPHQALGFTQLLTEMSTRNIKIIMFLGSKVRLVHKADSLTAIYEPIV